MWFVAPACFCRGLSLFLFEPRSFLLLASSASSLTLLTAHSWPPFAYVPDFLSPPSLRFPFVLFRPPLFLPSPSRLLPCPLRLLPRPTRLLSRPTRLLPRPTRLLPRPTRLLPRPTRLFPRPSRLLPRPTRLLPRPSRRLPCRSRVLPRPSRRLPRRSRVLFVAISVICTAILFYDSRFARCHAALRCLCRIALPCPCRRPQETRERLPLGQPRASHGRVKGKTLAPSGVPGFSRIEAHCAHCFTAAQKERDGHGLRALMNDW